MNRLNKMIEDQWETVSILDTAVNCRMVANEKMEQDYIREEYELDKLMGIAKAVRGFRAWKR